MKITDESRRRFLNYFSGIGLSATLLPGVLWAEIQQQPESEDKISLATIKTALEVAGLTFSEEDMKAMQQGVKRNLTGFEEVRKLHIPNDVSPPFYFSSITPGMKVNRVKEPLHFSSVSLKRPANLEECAFYPVSQLGHLLKN